MKNYYDILGIAESVARYEIRRAYINLAKQLHPDINKSQNAKSMFQEIVEAYQVLYNDELRKEYDYILKNGHKRDLIADFEQKVANIRDLAEFIANLRYIKALKVGLTSAGAGSGLSAGAYYGGRIGGIPGAIVGGIAGGIIGGIGGKAIGKTVENIQVGDTRRLIQSKMNAYISSQSSAIKKGIAQTVLTNWRPPHAEKPTKAKLLEFVKGNSEDGSFTLDNKVQLRKTVHEINTLYDNDPVFFLLSEYIYYLKLYGSSDDKAWMNSISRDYIEEIMRDNKCEEQKYALNRINQFKSQLNSMQESLKETNNHYFGAMTAICIPYLIICIILLVNKIWYVPVISLPFLIWGLIAMWNKFHNNAEKLEQKIKEQSHDLKEEQNKYNNIMRSIG